LRNQVPRRCCGVLQVSESMIQLLKNKETLKVPDRCGKIFRQPSASNARTGQRDFKLKRSCHAGLDLQFTMSELRDLVFYSRFQSNYGHFVIDLFYLFYIFIYLFILSILFIVSIFTYFTYFQLFLLFLLYFI